jgi:hypothetical protein
MKDKEKKKRASVLHLFSQQKVEGSEEADAEVDVTAEVVPKFMSPLADPVVGAILTMWNMRGLRRKA